MTVSRSAAYVEWRHGFGVVAISLLGFMVSVIHNVTMGPMIGPIQQSMGWSRSQVTAGMLIVSIAGIILTPFLGLLIDRIGVRRIGLCGMGLYCVGIASLSLVSTSIWSWLALWSVIGIAEAFINPGLWTVAVTQRFSAARGLAIAVVLCGGGLAMAIWPLLTNALIQSEGWRSTYLIIGATSALIILPLMFAMFRDAGTVASTSSDSTRPKSGYSLRQGLKTSQFARLAIAGTLMNVGLMALFVHFVPVLASTSISRTSAVALAGLIGVFRSWAD
jgi:MFS family permease